MYRTQRKLAKYLQEKNKVSIAVSEKERNDIALVLHNDITPYLASVKMRIEMMQEGNEEVIGKCVKVLEDCINQIRVISKQLSPIGIYEQSFWSALEHFIYKTGVEMVLNVQLIILDKPDIHFEQHNQIYRILQEIILNAVKHSRATILKIEISSDENNILIRTVDDGIGFDEQSVISNHANGLGLLNMYTHIDFLGGSIIKSDERNAGTKYNIRIPIKYEQK